MARAARTSTTRVFISSTIFFAIGNRHVGYTACRCISYPPIPPINPIKMTNKQTTVI